MSLMFDPQLALILITAAVVLLGLGWLTGRYRGLCRAGALIGVADVGIGLASGRLAAVVAGVAILACWLLVWRGRPS